MNANRWASGLAASVAMVLTLAFLAGCPARTEPPDWTGPRPPNVSGPGEQYTRDRPPPSQEPVKPPAEQPKGRTDVVSGVKPPLKARYGDEQKQKIISDALLGLQRAIVMGAETSEVGGRTQAGSAASDTLTTKLAELGFKVIATRAALPADPSEADQDRFRAAHDCNLAFLVRSVARQVDKFDNLHSFESDMNMKVLNLTTHQVLANKTLLKRGKRALSEAQAAEDAHRTAAAELAKYITDEVVRNWEATGLVKMRLVMWHLHDAGQADDIRVGLQRRAGIYYVSLERWDDDADTAEYEILCRFDVKRFMTAYVEELRKGKVEIKSLDMVGNVMEARRRSGH